MARDEFRPGVVAVLDVLCLERRNTRDVALVEEPHKPFEDRPCGLRCVRLVIRASHASEGIRRPATLPPHVRAEPCATIQPRKVLTERLNHLVAHGVLDRRPYDRRPRYEYVLTDKGAELVNMLMVMVAWGDKWLAEDTGPPVLYRHHACGQISHVELRCAHCAQPMHAGDIELSPGPGAAT